MNEEYIKQTGKDYQMNPAVPERIPESTFWPFVLAVGVMLFLWGILTSLIISGIGMAFISVSFAGWISDLDHEYGKDEKGD